MFIRSKKGEIEKIDTDSFPNEKDLYNNIWKIKFNIQIKSKNINIKESIINYVNGKNDFI